ncbi:hypothetical protein [Nocardiopsis alba]|uniref:hypothetical protein n=1 Tax=Nocardiopsis alba TaxID=53437 RepID=UPI0033C09D11
MPVPAATPPVHPTPLRRRVPALLGVVFIGSTMIAPPGLAHAAPTDGVVLAFERTTDTVEPGSPTPGNPLSVTNGGTLPLCLQALEVNDPGFRVDDFSAREVAPGESAPAGVVGGSPDDGTTVTATLSYAFADEAEGCAGTEPSGSAASSWRIDVPEPEPEPEPTPTEEPTERPTEEPTEEPTETPTEEPTERPTEPPTQPPTDRPTEKPTASPSPTAPPTGTPSPSDSASPTDRPSTTPSPTNGEETTASPSDRPSNTPRPSSDRTPSRGGGDVPRGGTVPTSGPQAPTLPRDEADLPELAPGVPEDLADLPLVTPTSDDDAETEVAADHDDLGPSITPAILLAAFLLALLLAAPLAPTRRVRLGTGYQGRRRKG